MSSELIRPLDANVVHRLRSSLVLTSMTQCVKELVHNGLDANASNIDISIDTEKFSLQVNDDGNGIQNLNRIGQRHVTSKCHTLSDISQLKTFGYRGEALAAITNESLTQIISRHYLAEDTLEGFWRDGALVGDIHVSNHTKRNKPGTSVIVRDLFYKLPVRRKKHASSAYHHVTVIESIKRLIACFALCFPDVSFGVYDSCRQEKVLFIKKTGSCLNTFAQLVGQEIAKNMQALVAHEDNIKIEAYFSTQSYPNKTHQYIYINNLIVPVSNELYKCVCNLFYASHFKSTVKEEKLRTNKRSRGRYIQKHPIFIVRLICPSWSNYDIDMYLDMFTEFHAFEKIEKVLEGITRRFLDQIGFSREEASGTTQLAKKQKTKSVTSLNSPYLAHSLSSRDQYANIESSLSQHTERNNYLQPPPSSSISLNQLSKVSCNSIDRSYLKRVFKQDNSGEKRTFENPRSTSSLFSNKSIQAALSTEIMELPTKLTKADLAHAKVLGQVDRKFIALKLAQTKDNTSLIMIDQHAADERIKLEEMLRSDACNSVATLEPNIVIYLDSLTELQLVTSERVLKCLKSWGVYIRTASHCTSDDNYTTSNSVILSASRFFQTADVSPHFESMSLNKRHNQEKYKIVITHLPKLIVDRCIQDNSIVKYLILDHAYWITEQANEAVLDHSCPKGIVEILKSKACRSAIMFNDTLSFDECSTIVRQLSKCNFPFQCAHGRPSAAPISLQMSPFIPSSQRQKSISWENYCKYKL